MKNNAFERGRLINAEGKNILTLMDYSSNCVTLVKANDDIQNAIDYLEVVNFLFGI